MPGAAEDVLGQVKVGNDNLADRRHARRGRGGNAPLLAGTLPLILLGASSGMACSGHLASIGYLKARFNTAVLFPFQVIVVTLAQFAALAIQDLLESEEPPRTALVRVAALGFGAAATLAITPVCVTKLSLLLNGALTSMLGTWLYCSSEQLAAQAGGVTLLSAGFGAGSLLTAILASCSQIGSPGGSVTAAYRFYGVASGFCLIGAMLWVWLTTCAMDPLDEAFDAAEREPLLNEDEDEEGDDEDEDRIMNNYDPSMRYHGPAADAQDLREGRSRAAPLAPGNFLSVALSFALLPMFGLASPHLASVIYQTKCLGDFFGRTAAVCHTSDRSAAGQADPPAARGRRALAAVVWLAAVLIAMCWLSLGGQGAPHWLMLLLVVGIYSGGSYWQITSEREADSRVPTTEAARKGANRWNMLVKFAGSLAGMAVGLVLVLTAPV
mmetsp:Transcript_29516/g.78109  ORF Transcript_29516/g.78109 Transcript_29516/m.78109 type:complete len:440 (-) Transcript_29516:48-1367(-)